MNKIHVLRLMLMLALIALLAAGCAKKPSPEITAPTPAPKPSPAPAPSEAEKPVAERPSPAVKGIEEQPVTDMPAASDLAAVEGLQSIQFEYDQHTLTDQAKKVLEGNAAWMKANRGVNVVIEGHCDERGSDEYNLALGERRALAAQSYLVSIGVDPGRLSTISYGEERPLDSGQGEAFWSKNRRAEFKVVK